MKTDPVCEMTVDERSTGYVTTFEGESYYFCSRECQNEFDQDPARYVGAEADVSFKPPRYESGGTSPAQSEEGKGLQR